MGWSTLTFETSDLQIGQSQLTFFGRPCCYYLRELVIAQFLILWQQDKEHLTDIPSLMSSATERAESSQASTGVYTGDCASSTGQTDRGNSEGEKSETRLPNTSDDQRPIDRIAHSSTSVYCASYLNGNHIVINHYPQQTELDGWNGPTLTIELITSRIIILIWGFQHLEGSIVQGRSHRAQLFYIRSTLVLTIETSSYRELYI